MTSCFAELVTKPSVSELDSARQKSHVTYTVPLQISEAKTITLLEAHSVLSSSGSTGLRTWEAALKLGHFLCSPTGEQMIRGKLILELGAGTGFLSILCAKYLHAQYVLATDGSGTVVEGIQSNLHLNGLEDEGSLDATVLKWGDALDENALCDEERNSAFDLVLGADVVSLECGVDFSIRNFSKRRGNVNADQPQTYDLEGIQDLSSTMRDIFLRYQGIKVLLSATLRNEATFATFVNSCSRFKRIWNEDGSVR